MSEKKSLNGFNSQLTDAGSEVAERETGNKTARLIG